jgi:Protein of unknown function (DUF616)
MHSEKLVVYTAAFGEGFDLPPVIPSHNVHYKCFTNLPTLTSEEWEIILVDPILPHDLPRSSREQKIRPHRWLSEFSKSLYIDTRVAILNDPQELWNLLIGSDLETFFGAFLHNRRSTVLAEFAMVARMGLDSEKAISAHLNFFRSTDPAALTLKPIWGGMLARRHMAPECMLAMEAWHKQVMKYSRRDQLSLPSVLQNLSPRSAHFIDGEIGSSDFHIWPKSIDQKPPGYLFDSFELDLQ